MTTIALKLTPAQKEVLRAHKQGRPPMWKNAPMTATLVANSTAHLVEQGLLPRLSAPPLPVPAAPISLIGPTSPMGPESPDVAPTRPKTKEAIPVPEKCPIHPAPHHRGLKHLLITDPKNGGTIGVLLIEPPAADDHLRGTMYHIYTMKGQHLGFTLDPALAPQRVAKGLRDNIRKRIVS